jgi:hypothetical protein
MDCRPILAAFSTWPVPEVVPEGKHANPATSPSGITVVQIMATPDEELAIHAVAECVYPSTAAGLFSAKARYPSVPWTELGHFWGAEIES